MIKKLCLIIYKIKWYRDYLVMEDLDFYEKHLMCLSMKKQREFFSWNPDFLNEYVLNPIKDGKMDLLQDSIYRGIMRKVKNYRIGE